MKLNKHIHPLLACAIVVIAVLLTALYVENRGQWECNESHEEEDTSNAISVCDVQSKIFVDEQCMRYCRNDGRDETDCKDNFCTKEYHPSFAHHNITSKTAVMDFKVCKDINGTFILRFDEVEVCDKKVRVKT